MFLKEKTWKKVDILIIILVPIVGSLLSLYLKTNLLISSLLYYGVLSLYLSLRTKKAIVKTIIFSIILAIPSGILDYLGVLDKSWYVATIFPVRLFDAVPLEDILWFLLANYSIIIFYEHFLDKSKHKIIDNHLKYLILLVFFIITIFFTLYYFNPAHLYIPYYYTLVGFLSLLLPTIIILLLFPKLLANYFITFLYFFVYSLIFELTALELHFWEFPGKHFIGWVELFGYRLPLEEFFYFFMISAMGVVSYFEIFDVEKI